MLKYLRWLLLPFSYLYAIVALVRNSCFDKGILKSHEFDMPVISVGNLDVGGVGKSPMTEYLIRLLAGQYKIATLSRGYGRKTKGFLIAEAGPDTAALVGDEPAQFKQKYPSITVAVCENRVNGIEQLKNKHDVIVLDDAYQHRAVKPGLSILLFDYSRLSEPHFILPAGNLREPFSGRKRANIIVVTKCPLNASAAQLQKARKSTRPYPNQAVFFTGTGYSSLRQLNGLSANTEVDDDTVVFLLTGIANAKPLVNYLKSKAKQVIHHNYADHHLFTLKNIAKLALEFNAFAAQKKLIVTTEKDAQRLRIHDLHNEVTRLPFFVMPIEVIFLADGQAGFNEIIENYVRRY